MIPSLFHLHLKSGINLIYAKTYVLFETTYALQIFSYTINFLFEIMRNSLCLRQNPIYLLIHLSYTLDVFFIVVFNNFYYLALLCIDFSLQLIDVGVGFWDKFFANPKIYPT